MIRVEALRHRSAFSRVLGGAAARKSNGWLTVMLAPNYLGYHRLGIIVSAKKLKSAVLRNLLKRQLRELLRHELLHHDGYDLIALARCKAPLKICESIAANKKALTGNVRKLMDDLNRLIATGDTRKDQKSGSLPS